MPPPPPRTIPAGGKPPTLKAKHTVLNAAGRLLQRYGGEVGAAARARRGSGRQRDRQSPPSALARGPRHSWPLRHSSGALRGRRGGDLLGCAVVMFRGGCEGGGTVLCFVGVGGFCVLVLELVSCLSFNSFKTDGVNVVQSLPRFYV